MKPQQNKDEVPKQTLILCHLHTAGQQVSGTVNAAAPEITQKCYFLPFKMFINIRCLVNAYYLKIFKNCFIIIFVLKIGVCS
jgi:hypothetical protein